MTSMGYHWKGEGWQKASDTGDTMTVTGWVGEIPKEPGQITHIWDQNIADINSSPNPVLEDLDDDVPQPVYDEVRKFYRDNFAKTLKYLNELKKAINNDLTAINKDINQTDRKSKENKDVIESENLKLITKKLQLQKEKIINIYNEVLLRLLQTERDRLNRESWISESDGDFKTKSDLLKKRDNIENVEIKKTESDISSQKEKIKQAEIEVKKAEDEFSQVKDAVKFTANFYKEVFNTYGEKAEQLAKALAEQARGKKIQNIEDALKAYEKHKANINKKINAKDRKAIATALESVKVEDIAKNFKRFSKGMGYVGPAIDGYDLLFAELPKAIESDNWRPFFVKAETIGAGFAATALTAFAFSVLVINPIGLIGYALIMAVVSAMIDEKLIEEFNKLIRV
ncbi:hypothetical protein BZ419_22545 [Salmonella enterica subsp. enterica serovar Enteritidis]|nr:hypothetical protein [Salmonella enterica subsp. enterica serovar Enteritidis]